MAIFHTATLEPLVYLIENLREDDRRELDATNRFENSTDFASALLALGPFAWVVYTDDGEPAHAIGAWVMWPGVCSVWSFGTNRTKEVLRAVTKHALGFMFPVLIERGVHRAECRSLADRTDLKHWFTLLGFRQEAVLTGFGSGREDFILYAWTADAPKVEAPAPRH